MRLTFPVSVAPKPSVADDDDPAEVDISEHHWQPKSRQMVPQQQQQNPFAGMGMPPSSDGAGDDPMMRMMQQMLGGGGGGDPNNPNAQIPNLPPMLQAMMGGQQQAQQQAQQPKSNSAYLWRVTHAVFALVLAFYIAFTTTFNGTKLSRAQSVEGVGPKLFYIFATTELVLQSSRYFLEKGQLQGAGWLAMIANSGLVPEPWGGYVRIVGRYSVIWQTIVGDAMTVIFVLGVLAWWKGSAIA